MLDGNNICRDEMKIDSLDECQSAVKYLKELGSDISFRMTETSPLYPKGCYKFAKRTFNEGNVYWNTHTSGTVSYTHLTLPTNREV